MAKTKISQFDATASNNTDINSVNVAEGCPPSGINNAIREMASLLKKQEVGTDAMTSPDIDGGTIDGATIGGSSGVTIGVSDGTVSAPSIKFTSDTNTGIYRGGTDILKFVTAGTDAVTITASQQVGIGASSIGGVGTPKAFIKQSTTSFYEGLLVSANANDNVISVGHTGTEAVIGSTYGTSGSFTPITFKTSNNDRLNIASNGDISFYEDTGSSPKFLWDSSLEMAVIGDLNTTAYGGGLVVATPTGSHITVADSVSGERLHLAGSGGSTTVGSKSNHDLQFITNDTLAVTIDTSQNLLVGTTDSLIWNESATDNSKEGVVIEPKSLQISRYQDTQALFNRQGNDGKNLIFAQDGVEVGSIGTNAGILYIGSPEGTDAFLGFGNDIIRPVTSAGASRDNAIDLGYNGMRFRDLYLSGGLVLDDNPTAVGGSVTSKTLDDYEEGTWTPAIYYQNADDLTNSTNVTQSGMYTKIGNIVTATGYLKWSATDARANDNIGVSGFPFTASNSAPSSETRWIAPMQYQNTSYPTSSAQVYVILSNNATVSQFATAHGTGNLGDDFGQNTNMIVKFTLTYHTNQ